MTEAWIELGCASCEKYWEENPTDLPASDEQFRCPDCGTARPTAEFMRSARDLDVLQQFHE